MAGQNYCEECGRSLEERSQKSTECKCMSHCKKCGKIQKQDLNSSYQGILKDISNLSNKIGKLASNTKLNDKPARYLNETNTILSRAQKRVSESLKLYKQGD